jgi:HemY protein
VLAIVVAAALGIAIAKHSGYVLISYGGFRYQSGLWAALGALVASLCFAVAALPGRAGADLQWRGQPLVAAQPQPAYPMAIEQGQLDLAEGRWAAPSATCTAPPRPSANRCFTTWRRPCRQRAGPHRRPRQPAGACLERQPQAELAIALTHAQLQMDRGETDGALETLLAMQERHPHNARCCACCSACTWSAATGRR